jgi:hypothetical protein
MTRLAPVHLPFLTTSNLESAQRGLIPGRPMLVGSSSEYWCDADDIKDMGAQGICIFVNFITSLLYVRSYIPDETISLDS